MITKVFNTREEVLQEAINYYWGKPERRCVDLEDKCVYHPSNTSDGCAIGRYIDPEIACNLPSARVGNAQVLEVTPVWLKDMGVDFLEALQHAHDSRRIFSEKGIKKLRELMELYVDFELITFPE